MERVRHLASRLAVDLAGLLYPPCCLVCGKRMNSDAGLCAYCLHSAFEPCDFGQPWAERALVLPGWMRAQYALWHFDKGGFLQDVLHHLKYGGRPALGELIGRELGTRMVSEGLFDYSPKQSVPPGSSGLLGRQSAEPQAYQYYEEQVERSGTADSRPGEHGSRTLLLPVPLHPRRERKRGYNQAARIAWGVARATGFTLASPGWVTRPIATATQTALGAKVRKKNMQGVYQLQQPDVFRGHHVIIVDDVLTTGATVLTLAELLRECCDTISVATVAVA